MRLYVWTSLVLVLSFTYVRGAYIAKPVADLLNSFAFDFQRQVFSNGAGNVVFSPFSVYSGVAMLYLGASGGTKEQIESMLKITGKDYDEERFLRELANLTTSLDTGTGSEGVSISTAVNGWVNHRFRILQSFRNQVKGYFGVRFKRINFGRPRMARAWINKWVATHTGQRINELFPAGSFTAYTEMVLANAIYFKGQWTTPFDKQYTSLGTFHTDTGVEKKVPFMSQSGDFLYGNYRGVGLLEIPYGKEGEFVMLFLKPIDSSTRFYQQQPGDISDVLTLPKVMTPSLLRYFRESLFKTNMEIGVPRFTLKKKVDLKEALQKLGMTEVFQPGVADLSAINGKNNLHVSTAQHQAFVQVDEEGTVAGAATGIGISSRMMRPRMQLNRPFLFYIIHKPQNAVVFAGRVGDPSL